MNDETKRLVNRVIWCLFAQGVLAALLFLPYSLAGIGVILR